MKKNFGIRFQQTVVLILTVVLIVLLVFYGYRPVNYNLSVGSICNKDIYAPRDVIDNYQTRHDAVIAKNSVNAILIRSEEMAEQSTQNMMTFFTLTRASRTQLLDRFGMPLEDITPVIESLQNDLQNEINVSVDPETLTQFLRMTTSAFNLIQDRTLAMTELIMMDNVNTDSLPNEIEEKIEQFNEQNAAYSSYSESISGIMNIIIQPNSVFDQEATDEAAENAYQTVMDEPILVEKGTKIISSGEVVTEHTYELLRDLELIRSETFDVFILARIALYIVVISVSAFIYIVNLKMRIFNDMSVTYALVITFLIPVIASVYLSDLSNVMAVTVFFTATAATYIGTSPSIVLSFAQILMLWPLYNFNNEYMFVSFAAVAVCAAVAGSGKHKYNSASLIIFPALFGIGASLIYNLLMGSTRNTAIQSLVWTGVSIILSAVLAVGLIPIYELFSRRVSPVRLIDLSQPGQPLLKRLFIEASGTYHHSMMVANLADAAAEAIGADALLCKVAAYYHDIGKLDKPMYFTENQSEGINPHDDLTIEQSVAILTAHPEEGVKLARKNKIPEPIINIINEHHGTTVPGYFYKKACDLARAQGIPDPDIDKFRYRGRIPKSRESAIVMIADTCEAAIKSMKIQDQSEIEQTIRKLIKDKIDQDQLKDSGLSFDDIEKIVRSFKQVYAGVFHERIKY
ncbi:MAG: HDIG domain-containing protein [Clostridiales bacterium]|nr:HDIG domain-containing protein [Clostridiales bacterium]